MSFIKECPCGEIFDTIYKKDELCPDCLEKALRSIAKELSDE